MRCRFRLLGHLSLMAGDDFPTALDGSISALPQLRRGPGLECPPPGLELLERRHVNWVIDAMTVPLERRAKRMEVALDLRDPLIFGTQRIAFLLDDLVDALVLAAQLLEQLLELGGIVKALGRKLPDAARGTFGDQPRDSMRVVDQGESAGQAISIAAESRHRQQCGEVQRRSAKPLKINCVRVDELRHPLLRGAFEAGRRR